MVLVDELFVFTFVAICSGLCNFSTKVQLVDNYLTTLNIPVVKNYANPYEVTLFVTIE